MSAEDVGVKFDNGCRITHGHGANIKKPFPEIPLTMHELSPSNGKGFQGQLGFIEFTSELRLPRHIHMDASKKKLVDERILVLNGVGLVEIAGEIWATAPGTLVDAVGGVPHTHDMTSLFLRDANPFAHHFKWSAAPAGIKLPDGTESTGKFTMVYEYEEPTSFFPTRSTTVITDASQYEPFTGDNYDEIRFPKLTAEQVVDRASIVFDKNIQKLNLA